MKKQWLLLPFLLLGACKTPADAKENQNMVKPAPAKSEILLRKIIGGKQEEKKEQYFECTVESAALKNLDEVKKWISSVPTKTVTAMHFVATTPSIQYLAYQDGQTIILLDDYSTMIRPDTTNDDQKAIVEKLISLLNEKCPTPKK